MSQQDYQVCLAPMMDVTDRHFRYLMRLLCPSMRLYTEMVVADALLHGQTERWLNFHEAEHPVVCQVGGSDPQALVQAAKLVEAAGFDEINLNVGCPSDRVQRGDIGACLMKSPELVATCVSAMKAAVSIPVTVKTRIGVDDHDDWPFLKNFVQTVVEAKADALMIHARKAWLQGLSPKQNRSIPPIDYERAAQVKTLCPGLPIVVNGDIQSVAEVEGLLRTFDGVMLGRAVWQAPFLAAEIHAALTNQPLPDRQHICAEYMAYAKQAVAAGGSIRLIIRPLQTMMRGLTQAKRWRQAIADNMGAAAPDWDHLHELSMTICEANQTELNTT